MDFQFDFDDEDFQSNTKKKSNKTGDQYLPYNVKICSPQWFASAYNNHCCNEETDNTLDENRSEQFQQMLKFDADLLYRQRNYSLAAQRYERLLDILPANGASLRLDAKESLSRCYTYLGLYDKSLELAYEIAGEISKDDDLRYKQSLSLLAFICAEAEQWEECIENLAMLCDLQPLFPQTWHKLGDVCSCFKSAPPADNIPSDVVRLLPVLQLTCYLRARMLLLSVRTNASHFVKSRNEATITTLSEKIEKILLLDSEKVFANQYLETEIENYNSGIKGDVLKRSEVGNHILEQFYLKFCLWHIHNKR